MIYNVEKLLLRFFIRVILKKMCKTLSHNFKRLFNINFTTFNIFRAYKTNKWNISRRFVHFLFKNIIKWLNILNKTDREDETINQNGCPKTPIFKINKQILM